MGIVEYEASLDRLWKITIAPGLMDEYGYLFSVTTIISVKDGEDWEEAFSGQLQKNGCADFGFTEPSLLHFCGYYDSHIIPIAYQKAAEYIRRENALIIERN